MSSYGEWAKRWPQAAAELQLLLVEPGAAMSESAMSESGIQSRVRLDASYKGGVLWRNNVGALQDKRGVPVRYGLANDSVALNKVCKSADLIGIKPVLVTLAHVGTTIGQFASIECKHGAWRPGEDPQREQAQSNWAALVTRMGGYAKIVATPCAW